MHEVLISMVEARKAGAEFYFTGKPCKNGHVAQRDKWGHCVECIKNKRKKAVEDGKHKEWYAKNSKKKIQSVMAWRKNNLERARKTVNEWRSKNIDHCRERDKKYRESAVERGRKYRAANPEKYAAKTRAWRQKYPDRARIVDANKKAKRKGADGSFTRFDVLDLFKTQRGRCAWCRDSIVKNYHVDHIQPICKGGTNYKSNLQLLCPPCNMRKHASDPIDFARHEGRLI